MNVVTLSAEDLAQRLIAQETYQEHGSEIGFSPALRVIEKLRVPLSKLAGTTGFRSLLARALVLARAYAPSLATLRVNPDGTIHGTGDFVLAQGAAAAGTEEVALLVELIGLLFTFIGEPLTVQLVRTTWPNTILVSKNVAQKEALQ